MMKTQAITEASKKMNDTRNALFHEKTVGGFFKNFTEKLAIGEKDLVGAK